MTVGAWQENESPDKGATALRPAVTIAWTASPDSGSCELWLSLYEHAEGRHAVIAPIGRLDQLGLARLERALEQARDYLAARISVELSRVHHIDYREVARLVTHMERSLAEGCEIRLEGVSRYLREIFRAAGVDLALQMGSGVGAACGTAPEPVERRTSALPVWTEAGLGLVAGPGGAE